MRRKPPPVLAIALSLLKTTILLVVLALGFGVIGGQPVAMSPDAGAPVIEERSAVIERAMAEHRCSVSGFGAGVIPSSALIRRDERVRQVSFDEGWAVFTGEAPGALIAVCLGELAMPQTSGVRAGSAAVPARP